MIKVHAGHTADPEKPTSEWTDSRGSSTRLLDHRYALLLLHRNKRSRHLDSTLDFVSYFQSSYSRD